MKVVLLAINAKYIHSSLSVWILAESISKYARASQDVSVVEATINQENGHIADNVAALEPEILGVSTYIWNAGKLPALLELLRKRLPGTIFVLGGPEASNNMEYWLENDADYVLHGEGEYSFPALLDEIGEGIPAEKAQKFPDKTAENNTIDKSVQFRPEQAAPEEPVDPYTDTYFTALNGRISYLETSRGCPFRCSFCLSAGVPVRYFPIDTVKKQINKLSHSGTQTIKLVDRTFNCNAERACELFDYIIRLDTDCRFHFEVAADLFDEQTLTLLALAPPGRIQLEAGLQSFHKPALDASSRQTDIGKAVKNITTLLQAGNIHIHADLIAGLPHETLKEFKESFNKAYALGAHTLQLGFLKLLHGSVMREQAAALEIQYDAQPPYEITSSPWMSIDDIKVLKQTENALQHTYNKRRFLSALEYVIAAYESDPFTFYSLLGAAVPNHGLQLEEYIERIYAFCIGLPGVDSSYLRDCMMCDWLSMVKGKNTPPFLTNRDSRISRDSKIDRNSLRDQNSRREHIETEAEKRLGHKLGRQEYAVLTTGNVVFVDSNDRDPVTGLYKVHTLNAGVKSPY